MFYETTVIQKNCGSTLTSMYAEGNEFAKHPQYRPKMAMMFPQLEELDSDLVNLFFFNFFLKNYF